MSPMAKTSGWPGQRQVGLDDQSSARPTGDPVVAARASAVTPRPDGGMGGDHAAVREVHLGVLDALDPDP